MKRSLKALNRILVLILIVCAQAAGLRAQTYPVVVNTQISPPYSPFLSDYTAAGSQRLMVNFVLRDATLPEYTCKLRLTIEGVGITIRTKASFVPRPLVLPGGGIPLQVYGEDLEEYFLPANLDFTGISRSQYEKGAKLPDGVYRFTIEVLDYNRGTVVSNKGTAVAWVILNDPPLLNLPRNDTKVTIVDPANIAFNWTPRHTASPNSAFTAEYIFRLVEIWPITRNPYDAVLSQQPLYEVTTNLTQLVYTMAEPALIPGRKYAWQVQAKDTEGRDLFKNQGRSEVYVFQYGDALGAPEGLHLQTANPTSLVVRWEQNVAGTEAVKYRVRYRPHNNRNQDAWYEDQTEDQWRTMTSLQPATEYEVQVRAEQPAQVSEYSPMKVFKTAEQGANEFVCKSDVPAPPAPNGSGPTFRLGVNDTIHAGGYDVLVRELTANANGIYTGTGMAIVPWFAYAKVKVTFKSIGVNEQHWLTSGEIKSVWNANSKFLLKPEPKPNTPGNTPNNGPVPVTNAETKTLIEITGAAIATVTKNEDGDIEIATTDGETKVLEKGESYSIVDEVGNGYVVDKEGNITKTTAEVARGAAERGDRNYTIALRFEKGDGKLGFDAKKYDALAQHYQQLESGEYIPWKAVTSKSDPVTAILEGTGIDPKKVRFQVNGVPLSAAPTGNTFKLDVLGKAEGTVEELLALYKPADTAKDNVLGKLNLVSYDMIQRSVVIVPVNQAKLPGSWDKTTLATELSNIYGQAVASWNVTIAETPLTVTLDETFDDGETGLLSNYTGDMKKVINAYGSMLDKTYYLFLVDKPRNKKDALGYMPRSKQAGFIFAGNLTNANAVSTLAHELGHGAFNLKHTFSEFPALGKGTTDNVMDYGSGTMLFKYQWEYVHDPQHVIGLFEDDEDSKSYKLIVDDGFLNKDQKTFSFLTYNGKIITLEKARLADVTLNYGTTDFKMTASQVPGVLQKFTLDDKTYEIDLTDGIYKNGNTPYADVPTVKREDIDGVVFGLPCNKAFTIYKFDAGNLERYTGTKQINYVKDVIEFPLRPFKIHQAISKNGSMLQQTLTNLGPAECYWCMDESTATMTKDFCTSPEILYITKLAQYRATYPSDFALFTSTGDDWANPKYVNDYKNPDIRSDDSFSFPQIPNGAWGNYLSEHSTLKADFETKKESEEFFKTMYVQLYSFTGSRVNNSRDFWSTLTKDTLAASVVREVNKLALQELKSLNFDKRKIAIEILMRGKLPEVKENAILLLLITVDDVDARRQLVEYMATQFTFSSIIDKFHDFFGRDNYTKVITTLSSFIDVGNKSLSVDKLQKAYHGEMITVDVAVFNEQSSYTIDKNSIKFSGTKNVLVSTPVGSTLRIDHFDLYTVSYDELVPIRFATNFTLGNTPFKKGQIKILPAIYACLLLDKGNQETLKKQGWLVFDGVLFVVGVGEVKVFLTAGNWLRKLIVAGDLIGSGSNLILDAGLADRLPEDIAHGWRIFNVAISLPQGISSLKNLAVDLISRSRAIKGTLKAADQLELDKGIARIEEALENSSKWLLWSQYSKKVINGEEFAIVGNRYYSKAAVEAAVPSQFNLPPSVIEEAIISGKTFGKVENGVNQNVFDYDNLRIVTEGDGSIVRTVSKVDFDGMELPAALQHVKFRDVSKSQRDIVGCHDATEFARVRQVSAIGNSSYAVAANKTLDQVEEIVILRNDPLITSGKVVPGVNVIEYKVPALNKGVTTGALKAESFMKAIYDPSIWPDAKLMEALREALHDIKIKRGAFVNGTKYQGMTKEGYNIELWYRNDAVQTFYFVE